MVLVIPAGQSWLCNLPHPLSCTAPADQDPRQPSRPPSYLTVWVAKNASLRRSPPSSPSAFSRRSTAPDRPQLRGFTTTTSVAPELTSSRLCKSSKGSDREGAGPTQAALRQTRYTQRRQRHGLREQHDRPARSVRPRLPPSIRSVRRPPLTNDVFSEGNCRRHGDGAT